MKKQSLLPFMLVAFVTPFIFSCKPSSTDNQLTEAEKKEGFTLLFDGETTNGWHVYNKGVVKSNWKVINSELVCDPKEAIAVADLVTDKVYKNYILKFEWKLSDSGNSGVFINVLEKPELPAAWASGPEYQLLDKNHPDYVKPRKRSGCLYDFTEQATAVQAKPAGEWNSSQIVQENGRLKFYLNDVLTSEIDLSSPTWTDTVSKTHFKEWPEFGKYTEGRIALQDWKKGVAFKNVKIREL